MAGQQTAFPPGPGGDIGAPWFARLSTRLSARFGNRRSPDLLDVLIAAGCFAVFSGPVVAGLATGAGTRPAITVFSVLACAPLIMRRRWPITTLAVLVAVYATSTLYGVQFTPFVSSAGPNLAIAIFTVADRYDRRTSLLAYGLAAICTWAVLGLGIYLHPGLDQDAVQAGAMIPGWFIGDAVRTRRLYRQSLARESDRQAAETEARIRAEERLRLSRDVHDVVSHSLSMIAVRSGVARLVLDDRPDEARAALAAIETASRSALDEVRLLLRQIREPSQSAGSNGPISGDIAELVRRFQENGLDLTYHCSGQPGSYGGSVEMSAFRITQEALTNASRHAPGARATLQITRDTNQLTVIVTDDGPARDLQGEAGHQGLGIAGMRERALLHDGEFSAGQRPGGGFEVVAVLRAQRGLDPEALTQRALTQQARRMSGRISVLIADDEALVRAGFRLLVEYAADLEVVGEAENGAQAVSQARALRPDVVLMDIRMPVMDGLEATRMILDRSGDDLPRVLVVTTFDDDENVFAALRSGASGFVLKDTPPEQLLEAIRIVFGGDALLTPSITRRLIAEFARVPSPQAAADADPMLQNLTEREREVLAQVASGRSNAEISAAMVISVATVKTHVSRLLAKLNARDRAQLVVLSYELGITEPRRPGS